MGVDTTIKIPIWAEFSKITEVIDKIMGNSYHIVPLDKKVKSIDKSKPSSKNNEWVMLFDKPAQMTTSEIYFSQNCLLVELKFKDNNNMGLLYNLNFHLEPQKDEQNDQYYHCITARCTPEIIFIGKKLVDFFGGKVVYTDTNSEYDEDNFYFREEGFFENYCSEDKPINDNRFF